MTVQATVPTLAEALWRPLPELRWWRRAVLVGAGVLLVALSAKVKVPMWPVPMTMQTLVVLAMAMAYGRGLATATMASYLALGALGLPVFAGTPEQGVGLAYMVGPTGGYLAGMLLAAAAVGWLAERGFDRARGSAALAMVIGNGLIYLLGIGWLGSVVGWEQPVLAWGLYPFLLGDALKIALAALALPLVWRLVEPRRPSPG